MSRRARVAGARAMLTGARILGAVILGAVILGASGCKKAAERKAPAATLPPIPEVQISRGRAACDDLVAKECACAEAHPERTELRDRCQLDRARPAALALALEGAARTDVDREVALGAQNTARQIIDNCVSDVAALPSLGCL